MTQAASNIIELNGNQKRLLKDIESRLAELWGGSVHITQYNQLSERISLVGRIQLEGEGVQHNTIIVKHIPSYQYPAAHTEAISQELREEKVCYEFLQTVRDDYPLFAQMLAFDERGFMLLEDLAPESVKESEPEEETLDVLSQRVAHTFASLHLATFGKAYIYQSMRKAAGLPEWKNDARSYSLKAHRRRYRLGATSIKDYCSILNIDIPPAYDQYIDLIEAEMEKPGIFHCFVHDDLANARQVIKKDNLFYLIDFENAKFSHALLDLCKPLAGKFEMLLDNGEFFYANPNFPVEFVQQYRTNLKILGGVEYDDAQWDTMMSYALLYHCIALVGKLIEISGERRLRKSFSFDLKTILARHLFLRDDRASYSPIFVMLRQLESMTNHDL